MRDLYSVYQIESQNCIYLFLAPFMHHDEVKVVFAVIFVMESTVNFVHSLWKVKAQQLLPGNTLVTNEI